MDQLRISSISHLHEIIGFEKPRHPLISLIDVSELVVREEEVGTRILYDLYVITQKDKSCGVEYGRNSFDFDEGVMAFSAPGQIYEPTRAIHAGEIKGWMLFFHPDLIHATHLGSHMDEYSFFNYDVFEALHLSDQEEKIVNDVVQNIKLEYEQRIDNHSHRVIVSNLELLLNYCLRYYERQFNTRTSQSLGITASFEQELKRYFQDNLHVEQGLPAISYFAEKVHLSQHYFSDLIKKETGRSPKDHINDFVIEKAKNLLLSTPQSVSEIAYDLGFNYPHYFTRLFKNKTGLSPVEYRLQH
ncbi:MAG: helix-turn-helix transcriptional regulator [Bacteroidia bacterium]|nr:helix-turn-helix transcriptional regulator [Bacteroidia bacterium]